jgi:hypothetical protein
VRFHFTELSCILKHVSPRTEQHADRKVLAVDLKVEFVVPSSALSLFHPDLTTLLYRRADVPDLVEQADPDILSAPRFPQLNPLKWDDSFKARVILTRALFNTTVTLPDADINSFVIECCHGGRAGITCRIQSRCDDHMVGTLAGFLDAVSTITFA